MHEFRRFIHHENNSRGWKQADLVRRSGLSRSHVSKLMRDDRDHLGQMPNDNTIDSLAIAYQLPPETVRAAAAAALRGAPPDTAPPTLDITTVPDEVLLTELARRLTANSVAPDRAR